MVQSLDSTERRLVLMEVYIVFVFDRNNYPSTTEYVDIFSTENKAKKYVEEHKKEYNYLQELYYEKKTVG